MHRKKIKTSRSSKKKNSKCLNNILNIDKLFGKIENVKNLLELIKRPRKFWAKKMEHRKIPGKNNRMWRNRQKLARK